MTEMKRETTAFTLKIIAIVTMLLDHVGAVIIEKGMYKGGIGIETVRQLEQIDFFLRAIGRISFPIFCYLLVEGFFYTSNRKKHAIRLGVFALLSEIPFDLAVNEKLLEFQVHNNVMFTLLLGFLGIWLLEYWKQKDLPALLLLCGNVVAVTGLYLLADWIRCDYGGAGILAILGIYVLHDKSPYAGYILAVVILAVLSNPLELVALFGLVALVFYRGRQGRKLKYVSYIVYPVHLLAFAGVRVLMGI